MRRAAPVIPEAALHMVSGRKRRLRKASIAYIPISDNAPYCGLPTPLLNHETSVTSFRAVEAISCRFRGGLGGVIPPLPCR